MPPIPGTALAGARDKDNFVVALYNRIYRDTPYSTMVFHAFTWPNSDGDPERWPPVGRHGPPDASWHEQCQPGDKKYELYETKVGQHVAERLKLPGNGKPVSCIAWRLLERRANTRPPYTLARGVCAVCSS